MSDKPEGYVFGRPTKYLPEYCQRMYDYFNAEPFYKEEIPTITKEKLEIEGSPETEAKQVKIQTKWEYKANKFPTLERFASDLGVTVQTLHNWCEDNQDFFDAFKICKQLQKDFIMQNGLLKLYDSGFAKFIAVNCTDLKMESDNNNGLDNEETEYDSSAFKKDKE